MIFDRLKEDKEYSTVYIHRMILMLMLLESLSLPVMAHDFTYKGILYTVIEEEERTCATKEHCCDYATVYTKDGHIIIPSEVSDENNMVYRVVAISAHSFYGDIGLKGVGIPGSVTDICTKAFYDCVNLESIEIEEGVANIEDEAFENCVSLRSVILPPSIKRISFAAFANCKSLETIYIPKQIEAFSLGMCAFMNCVQLRHITLPDSLRGLGLSTFYQCESLETIDLPASLISIADLPKDSDFLEHGVFAGCRNLKHITFPPDLSNIGICSFSGCKNLETIILPSNLEYLSYGAFSACPKLKKIIYPVSEPEDVKCYVYQRWVDNENEISAFDEETYRNAFLYVGVGAEEMAKMTEPWYRFRHIVENDGSDISIDPDFECDGLLFSVIDDAKLTCMVNNISESVNGTSQKIKNIEIPSAVDYKGNKYDVVDIGYAAFEYCEDLVSVKIPDTIESIGRYAFADCPNLQYVNIPTKAQLRGHNFVCTENLKEIWYLTDNPIEANMDVFSGSTYLGATLFITKGGLKAAQSISPWRYFNHIVEVDTPHANISDWQCDNESPKEIYSLDGQKIIDEDMTDLPSGFYVLVKNGKSIKIHKP